MRRTLLAMATTLASMTLAQAQFTATLTPDQDGGNGRSGTGAFTLMLAGTTITVEGTYSGLSANSTAGHIHGPAGPFPAAAGVLYDFAALGLTTFGGQSGTVSGSFELVDKTLAGNPYTIQSQIADLNNELWYVNIHSTAFGGGEIRGQIVPEPATLWLALMGLSGLAIWARRRAR